MITQVVLNSMIFFNVWNFFSDFPIFPWFPELVGTLSWEHSYLDSNKHLKWDSSQFVKKVAKN